MVYLAIIFHMHQPYYKNLLTQESALPWVRLHGIKDYLDMVLMLEKYPNVHLTFNLVPSLMEQVEDYVNGTVKERFLELSYKPAESLTQQEKDFIHDNFFMINKERVIALHPRYYELFLKKQAGRAYTLEDYRDLQVWFNLAWFDPSFRTTIPELARVVSKGRFFTEEDKRVVLDKQKDILKEIIPAYRKFIEAGRGEVTVNPYYHPILPLLYNTTIGKEANLRTILPNVKFAYPEDAKAQIDTAVQFYKERLGTAPVGMWPSEESVCEHILPFIIQSGIRWIVTDEALLFKSLHRKKRDTTLLYQPHRVRTDDGDLNIVFRDRNLSDLIGFVYHGWRPEDAVNDLMKHLQNIDASFKGKNVLVTIAMDGENAWEYYTNDGHDFLELWYSRLSESDFVKAVTVNEYLNMFPAQHTISRLAAGSWIFGDFGKWMGNGYKLRAWEYLALARQELDAMAKKQERVSEQALKQLYIAEGSDWFWWYGDGDPQGMFDYLFRMHLTNFYTLINRPAPDYLRRPLQPV